MHVILDPLEVVPHPPPEPSLGVDLLGLAGEDVTASTWSMRLSVVAGMERAGWRPVKGGGEVSVLATGMGERG